MADIRELYTGRVEAAGIALGRGDRSEAERLYSEALAMGEEHFGASDPSLAVPLNELSRLYVRRAEHARAEPLLNRLLDIRCASGASHPDVATVLAALAAVRRGLGDDTAAETLYRQALEIREVVHAPDHMAVVVTLEHLAETCAALRKVAEAKALLERALTVREKSLGAEHPTTKALRVRLTELTVNVAPIPAEPPHPLPVPPAAPAPEEARVSGELVFIYEPEKPKRRSSVRRDRVMTPPFSAAVAAASLITVPVQAATPAQVPAPTELAVSSLVMPDPREFDAAIRSRPDNDRVAHEPVPRRSGRIASPVRDDAVADRPKRRAKRFGLKAGGGVAVLASAAFLISSRLPGRTRSESAPLADVGQPVASVRRAPAAALAALVAAPARLAASRPDSARAASVKAIRTISAPTVSPLNTQAEKGAVIPDAPAMPVIGSVALPETTAPNADSVLRASTARRDTESDQIGSAGRLRAVTFGDDRSEAPPVLIGVIPQPRFPEALRSQGVEGVVVVQFLVGADGSVDPSTMKVVRSPHELFTAAVRNVLPKLHFQPARSADAKPHAEVVQYSIQFTATK